MGVIACLALIGLGYALVLHEQLSAHPWFQNPPDIAWLRSSSMLADTTAAFSVVRDQPFFSLGNSLACGGALLCSYLVCMDRQNAESLLKVIAWAGVAYAAFGIASYVVAPDMVLWREKVLFRSVLSGTFPNRNTAAIYFGVCAVLWALRLSRRMVNQRVFWEGRWRIANLTWDVGLAVSGGGFLLCFIAMMLTGSRAGIAISLIGISAAIALLIKREIRSRAAALWLSLPLLGGAALSFLVLGGQVGERLGLYGLSGGGRWEAYASTWQIISQHPYLGTGLGTFASVFPRFRSGDVSIWGVWDRAHNTLLELAAEVGIPLAALVGVGWILALVALFRGALRRQKGAIFPLAGFVCGAMAVLHSMVDFSLQVPGLAVTVMTLVGMGLAQRSSQARKRRVMGGDTA
nr:O-antigen ligase family protein [Bradyrhizobium symbiodeficiens]